MCVVAGPMPLMLDNIGGVMDIDDLFGEANPLSLPSRPHPREIYHRINTLRTRGSCQALAWSKSGCIASITADGQNLTLHNLQCSPRTGAWRLAGLTTSPQIVQGLDAGHLCHLAWSPNGYDLAVIDDSGRTTLLGIENTLNRPVVYRSAQLDPNDDLHAVVGSFWLPLIPSRQLPPPIHKEATKTSEGWRYDTVTTPVIGPHYPNPQKSAFVTVSMNGILRLLYYQADRKWTEASIEIENVVSSDELITHAAICADKGNSILIAYTTATQQISVVRVHIKWVNKINEKAPQAQLFSVSMTAQHILTKAFNDDTAAQHNGFLPSPRPPLSSLYFLPLQTTTSDAQQPPNPPVIVTVRHVLPSLESQFSHDIITLVDRWVLAEAVENVHSAFDNLSARTNPISTEPIAACYLKKLDSIELQKVLIGVQYLSIDKFVAFGFSDGTIEYRNRRTMTELYNEGGIDQFSHLSQIGFHMEYDDYCLHFALSPTSCSAVRMNASGKVTWKGMSYQNGRVVEPIEPAQYEAIIAGFAMVVCNSMGRADNHDDLLAMAHDTILIPGFVDRWLDELCRNLMKLNVDFSEEATNENVMPNPRIVLCFSIINSLGLQENNKSRKFVANLAWVNLQIRACLNIMHMAVNLRIPIDPKRKITMMEVVDPARMLTGSVNWALDLISYIVDMLSYPEPQSLFEPLTSALSTNESMHNINAALEKHNNIGMHLLLCSSTRTYLTAMCRSLAHIDFLTRKAIATNSIKDRGAPDSAPPEHISLPLLSTYNTIASLTRNSPVPIDKFEELLSTVTAAVKDSYTLAGLSSVPAPGQPPNMTNSHHDKRAKLEHNMLFCGQLPDELRPALTSLITETIPKLKSQIDQSKLFFHDFSLLRMRSSHKTCQSTNHGELGLICSFLHTPLGQYPLSMEIVSTDPENPRVRRYRRCTRCAAVMEDLVSRNQLVALLLSNARKCPCGGAWISLSREELRASEKM